MTLEELPDKEFYRNINEKKRDDITSFSIKAKTTFMEKRGGLHHEAVGALIIQNNQELRRIIIDECDNEYAPDVTADIIIGNVERTQVDPLLSEVLEAYFRQPCPLQYPVEHMEDTVRRDGASRRGREYILATIAFPSLLS